MYVVRRDVGIKSGLIFRNGRPKDHNSRNTPIRFYRVSIYYFTTKGYSNQCDQILLLNGICLTNFLTKVAQIIGDF